MLRSIKALHGDAIRARDGDMGLVVDVYFDDARWCVRYLVVDTGHVMPERRVLLAPACVLPDQPADNWIRVGLTRREVEQSPGVNTALPVWRQFDVPLEQRAASDPHLRSSEVFIGYHVHALDGTAGYVRDLVVDGGTWAITGVVVDTGIWPLGHRVLLDPERVRDIDRAFRTVHVGLTRDALRASPAPERSVQ